MKQFETTMLPAARIAAMFLMNGASDAAPDKLAEARFSLLCAELGYEKQDEFTRRDVRIALAAAVGDAVRERQALGKVSASTRAQVEAAGAAVLGRIDELAGQAHAVIGSGSRAFAMITTKPAASRVTISPRASLATVTARRPPFTLRELARIAIDPAISQRVAAYIRARREAGQPAYTLRDLKDELTGGTNPPAAA